MLTPFTLIRPLARRLSLARIFFPLVCLFLLLAIPALAQTTGGGAIQGTVTDPTGAAIPGAKVTAIAQASGTKITAVSTSAGLYDLTPLIPGLYTVRVEASGFTTSKQENIEVDGLNITGFNPKLTVGSQDQTVTVSEAPPELQTTSATVGAVITSETYESLPLVMNNQQRDPTAFATLAPGAQSGSRAPLFSGTGNYLAEVYIDGIPTTTSNQQGDNRVVVNGVPVESVDQLQIISSGPSAQYQGAGAIGFSIKTGGNQYHGQAVDLLRNTAFDTWGFAGNQATINTLVNGKVTNVPAGKPIEHQNELSLSIGGPIPLTHKKGFFFVNYDKYHGRQGLQPAPFTIPDTAFRSGDFTELGTGTYIYNPLSNACTSATSCSRQPYMGLKNGIPTANVIPASSISPISQFEQKFLPTPAVDSFTANNYANAGINGYDNHEIVANIAYDLWHGQRISVNYIHGVRASAGYLAQTLPLPYVNGDTNQITPTMIIVDHSIPITSHLVNQFDYGFTRFPQPVIAPTAGMPQYSATAAGITGLPNGQASGNFPGSAFGTTTAFTVGLTQWTENGASDASHNVVPNAFTIADNLTWTKGKHNMVFGFQTQWLEDNVTSQSSPSGVFYQTWSGNDTANYSGATLSSTSTGLSYASFLVGAVNSSATSVPLFSETGGRFHPWSPYFQDNWQVRPNITVNLGLRWDYLPPYHEVHDNWSFFNPNATNPLVGVPGLMQYAGSRGADISCQCRTPVNTYWKNFGPRVGIEWQTDPKTVIRAGYALAYSRAGGVGGRAGDSTGTGQTGFGSSIILPTAVTTGVGAGPSYFLNNSTDFTTAGAANTNFGGPGYAIPAVAGPSAAELTVNTGNYLSGTKYATAGGAPSYADPYLSGRAPEFNFYNLAIQRAVTQNLTLTVGYSGSESHFVAGAGQSGFWSGQINPAAALPYASVTAPDNATNILNSDANAGNVAIASAAGGFTLPYPTYQQPASTNSNATIARALRPYPQYSAPPSPEWDNIANITYNSLQITLKQREYKGVSFTANYTYSRNIGDDGTTRSAFAVPAAFSSDGVALPGGNRADRDLVATNTPENLHIYGYAKSPFGRNKMLSDNWVARTFLGGWQTSGIFSYTSGTPILVVGSGCSSELGSGVTCMPDLAPGRSKSSIRINGGYGGPGVTYANYAHKQMLDPTAFAQVGFFSLPTPATGCQSTYVSAMLGPQRCGSPITKIGDSPRSNLNLYGPSSYNLDMALQREFPVITNRVRFIFRVDCFNVSNRTTFSIAQTQTVTANIAATANATSAVSLPGSGNSSSVAPGTPAPLASNTSFGLLSGASGQRKFQFSGRIQF